MRFCNKLAVITGGASGIGFATAQRLCSEGAIVLVNDLDKSTVDAACAALAADGGRAHGFPGNAADEAFVGETVRAMTDGFGNIDILVCSAGIAAPKPATDYSAWHRIMAVNLHAPYYWAREVAKVSMLTRRSGVIVNVASTAGLTAFPGDVGYIASKHGLIGLTKALAMEWAGDGIRVNCLCPGLTSSAMVAELERSNPERMKERRRRIPLNRTASAYEQAACIAFLCSDDASYMTGHSLINDGGQLALYSGFASQQ